MTTVTKLSNGIRIVLEEIPHVRSISLGIWVKNGSINENEQNSGISHYIEHMMFKGTYNRSAKKIAEEMDAVGGQINAYTTKEYTCYHTRTLDKHFDIALDILSDMFLNSKFDDEDIIKERNVIMEEINMYEDTPEDLVHELLQGEIWRENSIGMPILGTKNSISSFDHNTLCEYFKDNYRTDNTVISITGNFKSEDILTKLEGLYGSWGKTSMKKTEEQNINYFPTISYKKKDTEQIHLVIAFPCEGRESEKKYAYTVFNTVFGGGMSSLLFQKIREDNGLTYSIYSYLSQYTDTGIFAIYAGMNPNQTERVLKLILEEIEKIKKNGIDKKMLAQTKEQIISNYIIGNESTVNRMTSNGGSVLLRGSIKTQEETIDSVEKVSMTDIENVVSELFDFSKISISAVGKTDGINLQKMLKALVNA